MTTVILSHQVHDFAQWKKGFDSGEAMRSQAGVKTLGVYTETNDPNSVIIITEFPNAEIVQGFLSNPQLQADMEAAGVVGRPDVKILDKV